MLILSTTVTDTVFSLVTVIVIVTVWINDPFSNVVVTVIVIVTVWINDPLKTGKVKSCSSERILEQCATFRAWDKKD